MNSEWREMTTAEVRAMLDRIAEVPLRGRFQRMTEALKDEVKRQQMEQQFTPPWERDNDPRQHIN